MSFWISLGGVVLVGVMFASGGCTAPQLGALKRSLDTDPRELVRVYDACRARVETPAALDECMAASGYRFLAAADQDYRASECWDSRYSGRYPQAYCYVPDTAKQK